MAYQSDFENDRNRIEIFLNYTESLIQQICYGDIKLKKGAVLPWHIRPLAMAAFKEYTEHAPQTRHHDVAYTPDAKTLANGGLLGKQLELKLSLVESLKVKFNKLSTRGLLIKLIDAIDTTLDSLVALAGVQHALKELKDILRGWIKETV